MIEIQNNGQEIARTNYWETEHAAAGFFFLSINAGAFRLLVPAPQESQISEMTTAVEVIVSRGPWPARRKDDALELLFEDHTGSPFSIHLIPEQCDRLPTLGDRKGVHVFSIWTSGGKQFECPAYYRIVHWVPWLRPLKRNR